MFEDFSLKSLYIVFISILKILASFSISFVIDKTANISTRLNLFVLLPLNCYLKILLL